MTDQPDARLSSPAVLRNRGPILDSGLKIDAVVPMPANNLSVIVRR